MTIKTLYMLKMSNLDISWYRCSEGVVTKDWWLGWSKDWDRGLSSIGGKAAGQAWGMVSHAV